MNNIDNRMGYGNFDITSVISFSTGRDKLGIPNVSKDQFRSLNAPEPDEERVTTLRSQYFSKSASWGAEKTTEFAVNILEAGLSGTALDIGSGSGRAIPSLLKRVDRVIGVEIPEHEDMFYRYNQVPTDLRPRIQLSCGPMEAIELKPDSIRILNADYSIPFCHPDYFNRVMEVFLSAVQPGGVFCGTFFGPRDGYGKQPNHQMSILHSLDQLKGYFTNPSKPWTIKLLGEEFIENGPHTAGPKDWHIYYIVAQKSLSI